MTKNNKPIFFPNIDNIEWKIWYKKMPQIEIKNNMYYFKTIRDFNHKTNEVSYFNQEFDINYLDSIILHSIPFWFKNIFSHMILEFKFKDRQTIFLSVEARRQPNEWFSIIKWLFKHYGLIYLWWTEDDLIGLRRDIRKKDVFSYKLNLSKEQREVGFKHFVEETNKLYTVPQYYHSIMNNCTTTLWDALKIHSKKDIRMSYKVIFSAYVHEYLRELWYIN